MTKETGPELKRYTLVYDELQEDDDGALTSHTDALAYADAEVKKAVEAIIDIIKSFENLEGELTITGYTLVEAIRAKGAT